jgi:hypothetical protein
MSTQECGFARMVSGEGSTQALHALSSTGNLLVPSQSYWAPLSHLPASRNVRTHIKSVRAPLAQAWARAKGNPSYMSKVGWMIHKFNKVARLEKVEQINRD